MMRVSGNVWFEVSKRGEQKYHDETFVCDVMFDDESEYGNVWFEVSKRSEQKSYDECSFVM